ncbi:site-specific DNA-methyltransferase [Solwaraspora sp. WMMD937]|uniref:site-specific DNA-methyltransferase n=1 Tax=Solwaraspora sp. WMMD937 TaxID=3016090 RepID=UPI00249B348D|nr:site-specific DNA-methyltransferase [Solwaraspora sp. WMMD937]WFE20936.1 site-specific DNA-methyltransferase [Solwaraspora sp. WMMD937]
MPPRAKGTTAKAGAPLQVIRHEDKRVNNPTAGNQDLLTPEAARIDQYIAKRDPNLDPQLVWTGKEAQDTEDLVVEAPPIYIQEKIAPRTLIDELRQATKRAEPDADQLDLFANDYRDFDGLDSWESVEFYQHEADWSNRMILGDSLRVMASLAEKERMRGKVQMIYLDPPYGIKFGSNWQRSIRKRDVKDGSPSDTTREVEQIKAFRDTWELGIHSYLSYLRDRLTVARDLLTESGSIFVQIGDENVHLVRTLLDEVFGPENFQALISFKSMGALGQSGLAKTYDYLIWYASNAQHIKFRPLFQKQRFEGDPEYRYVDDPKSLTGYRTLATGEPLPEGYKGLFRRSTLTSSGYTPTCTFDFEFKGKTYRPFSNKSWRTNMAGMRQLLDLDRIFVLGGNPYFKRYASDFDLLKIENCWNDPPPAFARRYVVETATKFVERCMLMCTDPGDLVLDPTCGSGTTAFVAEQWGRRWITIDTSRVALALARQRIIGAKYPAYLLADSHEGRAKERELSGADAPLGPPTSDVRKGFVYERVPHITLKSIANNPDIKEGMTRQEIDAAIKRHADTELLYDRPYEDKKKLRVAGKFTVESLSPHRSPTFNIGADQPATADADSYLKTIFDNLTKAGVQNGWRKDRLEFASLTPHAGKLIHAEGAQRNGGEETPTRIAVSVGPQYGTVDADWIKQAARESLRGVGFDMLLVCGFSFDALAGSAVNEFTPESSDDFATVAEQRKLGRLPILLVRMNADLAMGDTLLKKTGTANLFTVFGEPDVAKHETPDGLVVEIRGVDVYNPTTGELRGEGGTDDIAMWMLDTDYNEEEFCVRHIYFAGSEGKPDGLDPYARLRKVLRAEVDDAAWASLYSTRSRPFPRPQSGKFAVKVINHYGDEVLQVYDA